MIRKLAVVSLLVLAGCNTGQQGNLAVCEQALFAAHSSNPAVLALAALNNPACQGLVQEAINAIISRVSLTQRARGIR